MVTTNSDGHTVVTAGGWQQQGKPKRVFSRVRKDYIGVKWINDRVAVVTDALRTKVWLDRAAVDYAVAGNNSDFKPAVGQNAFEIKVMAPESEIPLSLKTGRIMGAIKNFGMMGDIRIIFQRKFFVIIFEEDEGRVDDRGVRAAYCLARAGDWLLPGYSATFGTGR